MEEASHASIKETMNKLEIMKPSIDHEEVDVYTDDLKISSASTFQPILNSDSFVDKTLLLRALFGKDDTPKVMITAPRRFGKSVNMDMVQRFLEFEVDNTGNEKAVKENLKLFTSVKGKLKIMNHPRLVEKHFGKYPIIKANFYSAERIDSMDVAMNACRSAISEAFKKHKYLYKQERSEIEAIEREKCRSWCLQPELKNEDDVISGLKDLSEYLVSFHGKKVVVLVDEFDCITSSAMRDVKNKGDRKNAMELVIEVIGTVVKDNDANICGCLITGILDVKGTGISNKIGNILRSKFGSNALSMQFYGFRMDEVDILFEKWKVPADLRIKALDHYNKYYDVNGKAIFNPYSVVMFLRAEDEERGRLQDYWQQSGYMVGMLELFQNRHASKMLSKLLEGGSVEYDDNYELTIECLLGLLEGSVTIETVISFLLYQGYLSYTFDVTSTSKQNSVVIPNESLKRELKREMIRCATLKFGLDTEHLHSSATSFSNLVTLCDLTLAEFTKALETFQRNVTALLQTANCLIEPLNESTLQTIMTIVCLQSGFFVGNEAMSTDNTPMDVIAYTDAAGVIIELKCYSNSLEKALGQIFESRYYTIFKHNKYYFGQKRPPLLLLIGLHTNEVKHVSVNCLRREEICDILKELGFDTSQELEECIENALNISIITDKKGNKKKVVDKQRSDKFVKKSITVS